ncbi:MAG: metallophosphatase family protein [Gammaproteobacteria bacterium]|jgi:putative phosphoesterase|nr:metallophosphatase family protein [Gammaproteobacteria bacterium]
MTTRIGLISDVHSSPVALAEALRIFVDQQVDDIICAGDIAGYYDSLLPTVRLLVKANCKTIVGNHDQTWLEQNAANYANDDASADSGPDNSPDNSEIRSYLQQLPQTLELSIEGKRLFIVHANPPSEQHGGIKLRDRYGNINAERKADWTQSLADFEHDVLIVGHTHQVYAEQLGRVLVINPGSVPFNHSCMVLSLPDLGVETYALGGREITHCWNFSMLQS